MLGIAVAALIGGTSYTFGGFDADEAQYLKRGADDVVCAPPAEGCRPVDKKTARGFVKPARTRKLGDATIVVTLLDEGARLKLSAGERELGTWSTGTRVLSANANVFVSPGGGLVAVEFEANGKTGKVNDVVVFDVTQAAEAPRAEPKPVQGGATAYERALGKGGVWEQRLQACDQAGVHLELKKTRHFAVRIMTKCQGRKDDDEFSGTWTTEGTDALILSFENEEGPLERLECRFATCADAPEDCLTCRQDDVVFTLQVVRRR